MKRIGMILIVLMLLATGCESSLPTPAVPTLLSTTRQEPATVPATPAPIKTESEEREQRTGATSLPVEPSPTLLPSDLIATAIPPKGEMPSPPADPPPPVYGGQTVEQAKSDLAQRLGLSPEAIVVVSISGDEFPADTLGCPGVKGNEPRPIPALITGQRILLEVDGNRYTYHAHGSRVVFCGLN